MPGASSKIMPFKLSEIVSLSSFLKDLSLGLVELAFPETRTTINDHYRFVLQSSQGGGTSSSQSQWPHLLKVCVSLLRQLHTRDLRRGFCPPNHWVVHTLNLPLDKPTDLEMPRGHRHAPRPFQPIRDFTREDFGMYLVIFINPFVVVLSTFKCKNFNLFGILDSNGPPLSTKQVRSITILREIPFVVPFNTRVGIFQGLLAADRLRFVPIFHSKVKHRQLVQIDLFSSYNRAQGDQQGFLQGPSIQLIVRRSHLYEDAFDKLRPENGRNISFTFSQ